MLCRSPLTKHKKNRKCIRPNAIYAVFFAKYFYVARFLLADE